MIEDRPLTLLPERRETFISPLANPFPSVLHPPLFIKGVILLACLCFFLTAAPLQGAKPPEPAAGIGPEACWLPDAQAMGTIRTGCAPLAGTAFEDCFVSGMQKSGASPQAVAFTKSIGNLGYMEALRQDGPVDVAFVVYPFRANENQGFLLINGAPPRIDVDDLSLLSPDHLKKDPRYVRLKRQYPAVALWSGDRSGKDFPRLERMPDGGQRFIVRYRLLNGCHACELAGYTRYAFEFDKTGRFTGTKYLGLEKPEGRETGKETLSDPAAPVAVREGQTFTLTLRSNPTTGYIWQLSEPLNERIIRFVGNEYRSDKTGLIGAGGTESWTFKAVGSGETRISLKFSRPWEKGTAPAKTAQFKIIISSDMNGKGASPGR